MTGLQEAFYIIGIIFMVMYGVFLIAIIVALVRIRNEVEKIRNNVINRAMGIAGVIGASIPGMISKKVREWMGHKKSEE